jgi:uncharacterized protein YjbI with pentapeptide repeats
MPRRVISQPLPRDLRNWSFRWLDCEGWDFSGRDLRGCDFRNTNLTNANFAGSLIGRSRQQNLRNAFTLGLLILISGLLGIAAPILTPVLLWSDANTFLVLSTVLGAFLSAVVIVGAIGKFASVPGSIPAAFVGGLAGVILVFSLNLIEGFQRWGRIDFSILIILLAFLVIFYVLVRGVIQACRNSTGTNFKGATLTNADFSDVRGGDPP